MSPFQSFYDNSFDTKCPGLKGKKIIHYANIVLYLGSAIALPMIFSYEKETEKQRRTTLKETKSLCVTRFQISNFKPIVIPPKHDKTILCDFSHTLIFILNTYDHSSKQKVQ
jgi:hypothetical protein